MPVKKMHLVQKSGNCSNLLHLQAIFASSATKLWHNSGALHENGIFARFHSRHILVGRWLKLRALVALVGGSHWILILSAQRNKFNGLNRAGNSGSEPVGIFALRPGYERQHRAIGIGRLIA